MYLCLMKTPKVIERKLGKHKARGLYYPDSGDIAIDPQLSPKLKMEVYLHEYYHHIFPEWTEEQVDKMAKKTCNFLWKQKYRRVEI